MQVDHNSFMFLKENLLMMNQAMKLQQAGYLTIISG